jgi:hypothetical protein
LLYTADIYISSKLFRAYVSKNLYTISHTINWRPQYGYRSLDNTSMYKYECFAPVYKMNKLEKWNYYQVLKYLYNIGIETSQTLLDFAIEYGNFRMVKYFCNVEGAISNHTMDTAIHCNNIKMVMYLYSIGVEADYQDLGSACRIGNMEMVQYIHKYMNVYPNMLYFHRNVDITDKKIHKYIRRIVKKMYNTHSSLLNFQ